MNQTVDILCRARELYASAPSHARIVPELGTYCPIWALNAAESHAGRVGSPEYDALVEAMEDCSIAQWNATHSTGEVLAAFDRAIAAQRLVVPPLQRAERHDPVHTGQES